MNCLNCGTQLKRDDIICPVCGMSQTVSDIETEEEKTQTEDLPILKTRSPVLQRIYIPVILITGIVIIAAALFVVLLPKTVNSDTSLTEGVRATNVKTSLSASNSQTDKVTDTKAVSITDISADYDSTKGEFTVFFGLKNVQGQYLTASEGSVDIVINNSDEAEVYHISTQIKESDFTNWTNIYWNSSRMLGSVVIKAADITAGTADTGTLYFTLKTDTISVKSYQVPVTDLPVKSAEITLPKVPLTLSEYLDNECISNVQIEKLLYTSRFNSVDGLSDVTFQVYSTTPEDSKDEYSASTKISYRVLDSNDTTVAGGSLVLTKDENALGGYTEFVVYSLKISEKYTLELTDYND